LKESCDLCIQTTNLYYLNLVAGMTSYNLNMMHSVALGESNMIVDDDFVVVDSDHVLGDADDCWDYCDDVFSTTSSSPCFSVCSDLPAKIFEEVEDMDDTEVAMPSTDDDYEDEKPDEIMIENTLGATSVEIATVDDNKGLEIGDDPHCKEKTQHDDDRADDDVKGASNQSRSVVSDDDERDMVCRSRLSNKKRRKKLKLMKKAVAAAAAAATLSELSRNTYASPMLTTTTSTARQQAKVTIPTKAGKKANVAVSCAHESLASYRQELALTTRKCK
jgi:hypothetical protein